MEEEEDEIVGEFPVYFSKNDDSDLFLFQYPNKTRGTDMDSLSVAKTWIKPINHEVKIEYEIDTESPNYDPFKGKKLAEASDSKNKDPKSDKPVFRAGVMNTLTYVSTKPVENVTNYLVGYIKDKEVHLSPLTNILQMRPSFSYFDKEDKRNKAEKKAANEEDDDEELQQVTVKFSRNETERLKGKPKENSSENQEINSADEPWCEATWHCRSSPTAEIGRMKLLASNRESIEHTIHFDGKEYLKSLIPQVANSESIDTIVPSKIITKAKLKTLNLTDQLKNILKDVRMMSFVDIMSIVEECDKTVTTEKVLRTLPLVGLLIRGNWVPQSDLLYPPESLSNVNGVPAELMVRGRNYVLHKYMKQEHLLRRKVIISTQLPPEEATEILQSVARLNIEKKWELLIPPDVNFELRYADIAQRQELVWRPIEQMFSEMDFEKSPKRSRKRSIREVKIEKT